MRMPKMYHFASNVNSDHSEYLVVLAWCDFSSSGGVFGVEEMDGFDLMIPTIDLVEDQWFFKTEQEAWDKMKDLWAKIRISPLNYEESNK